MHELKTQEIEQISLDIEQQGLTYTPLQNELLDHICCQIEILMEQGMTFNEAYRKVRAEMGKKRIRQIQHETLSLISKKYRRMKRTMNVFGVMAPILLFAGLIFKVFHWPGAGILITLGLFITGMVFLPLFAMVRIRDTRQQDDKVPMGLYLTGMIAGMLAILGALFKVQHWPGASIFLAAGLVTLAFAFLPIYAVVKKREAEAKNEAFNSRLIIGGVIAGSLVIIGALFKIMHWPGAGIVILVSWSLVAVILFPYIVLNQLKQKENKSSNFMIIILVAVAVSILILARVRSQPWDLLLGYYLPNQNYVSNAELLNQQNDHIIEQSAELLPEKIVTEMNLLSEKSDALCGYIQDLKIEMVSLSTHPEGEAIDEQGNIVMWKIYDKTSQNAAYELVVKRDEYKLYHMLKEFSKYTSDLSSDMALTQYISTATMDITPIWPNEKHDEKEAWADYCIHAAFPRAMNNLSMYQSTIRIIENQLLLQLQSKKAEG